MRIQNIICQERYRNRVSLPYSAFQIYLWVTVIKKKKTQARKLSAFIIYKRVMVEKKFSTNI